MGNVTRRRPSGRRMSPLWRQLRRLVLARDRVCQKCGAGGRLEVDHIKPRSQGGMDTLGNLQALCPACHKVKSQAESVAGKRREKRRRMAASGNAGDRARAELLAEVDRRMRDDVQ